MTFPKGTTVLALIILALTGISGLAQSEKKIRQVFVRLAPGQYSSYTFYGLPVQGYGVGSVRRNGKGKFKIDANVICTTFDCLQLTAPPTTDAFVTIDPKYVEVVNSAPISFSSDRDKALFIQAILPAIDKIVGVNFTTDLKKKVTVTFTSGDMVVRRLKTPAFDGYLADVASQTGQASQPDVQRVLRNTQCGEELTVVTSDIILKDLNLHVSRNDTGTGVNTSVDLAGLANQVGAGASAKVQVNGTGTTGFDVRFNQPIVVGYTASNWEQIKPLGSRIPSCPPNSTR